MIGDIIDFGSGGISKFPKMECYYKRDFPSLGIVGRDVAINSKMNPVVIEANLNSPGIQFEQLAILATIFGDRIEEVVDYVVKHKQI